MTHKHTFWDRDRWDQRGSERWGLRQIKPEMHSLQKLMRQAFYHRTRSGVLKAAVNVCLHRTAYWLNQLFDGADSGDLDWGFTQPQRRHVCFCECRSRGENICWFSSRADGTIKEGLLTWASYSLNMYSVEHLALSVCLAICLCRCVSNDVKYLLSRSCSGFKMFRNSFSLAGGGKKSVKAKSPN